MTQWRVLGTNQLVNFTVVCVVTWPLSGSEAGVEDPPAFHM